jgi:hypothetical protein
MFILFLLVMVDQGQEELIKLCKECGMEEEAGAGGLSLLAFIFSSCLNKIIGWSLLFKDLKEGKRSFFYVIVSRPVAGALWCLPWTK